MKINRLVAGAAVLASVVGVTTVVLLTGTANGTEPPYITANPNPVAAGAPVTISAYCLNDTAPSITISSPGLTAPVTLVPTGQGPIGPIYGGTGTTTATDGYYPLSVTCPGWTAPVSTTLAVGCGLTSMTSTSTSPPSTVPSTGTTTTTSSAAAASTGNCTPPTSSSSSTTTTTSTPALPGSMAYSVSASTHIAALNSTIAFGTGTGSLAVAISPTTGDFAGNVTLPDGVADFSLFGSIPGTATVRFIPTGTATGTYQGGVATYQAAETIRLTSLSVFGRTLFTGSNTCQTSTPAQIVVKSGPNFRLTDGGSLTGTYTIAQFTGCGPTTPLVNAVVAGPGNTISAWLVPTP